MNYTLSYMKQCCMVSGTFTILPTDLPTWRPELLNARLVFRMYNPCVSSQVNEYAVFGTVVDIL
jgi:hypothetical protein